MREDLVVVLRAVVTPDTQRHALALERLPLSIMLSIMTLPSGVASSQYHSPPSFDITVTAMGMAASALAKLSFTRIAPSGSGRVLNDQHRHDLERAHRSTLARSAADLQHHAGPAGRALSVLPHRPKPLLTTHRERPPHVVLRSTDRSVAVAVALLVAVACLPLLFQCDTPSHLAIACAAGVVTRAR